MNKIIFLILFFHAFILPCYIKIFNNCDKDVEVQLLKRGWCCDKVYKRIQLPNRNDEFVDKVNFNKYSVVRLLVSQIVEEDYKLEKNKIYKFVVSNDKIYQVVELINTNE